jgi:hypothetical protein
MPYQGRLLDDATKARKIIYETLEQQPGWAAPLELEVTDEKMRLVRTRSSFMTGTSGLLPTVIYYANIADVLLSEKRGQFMVSLLGANRVALLYVYTNDQASAERFIDAVETLRRALPHHL